MKNILDELSEFINKNNRIVEYVRDLKKTHSLELQLKDIKISELTQQLNKYTYTGEEVDKIEKDYEEQIGNLQKEVEYWQNNYQIIVDALIKIIYTKGE